MLQRALYVPTVLVLCTATAIAHATPKEQNERLWRELWLFSGAYSKESGYQFIDKAWGFLPLPSTWLEGESLPRFFADTHTGDYNIHNWQAPSSIHDWQASNSMGYMDDLENTFLYVKVQLPSQETIVTLTKGYPKKDGSHVYLCYAYTYRLSCEFSTASEPWDNLLPTEFSPALFLGEGQKFQLGELDAFVLRLHLPRVGTRMALSLMPVPLGMLQAPMLGVRFVVQHADGPPNGLQYLQDAQFLLDFFTYGSKAMVTAMEEGKFDAISTGDFQNALMTCTDNAIGVPAGYTVQQFKKDCALLYNIYRTQQKIGFSHIVMDWNAQQERFVIVGKIQTKPLTFQQFLKIMPFFASR